MRRTRRFLKSISITILALIASPLYAETLYVTDRIVLGIHKEPAETSAVLHTVNSGTALEVVTRQDEFIKVRLADGKEGWANAAYLKKDEPATVELDALHVAYDKLKNTNAALEAQIKKLEQDLQVKRDQLSNARSTIEELEQGAPAEQAAQQAAPEPEPDPAMAEARQELSSAQQTIESLEAQIAQLKEQNEQAEQLDQGELNKQLQQVKQYNKALEGRIELALASLEGKKLPSPEELAAIRPTFPFWYWLLLLGALIVGAIIGLLWLDHRHRQRHGGFRV